MKNILKKTKWRDDKASARGFTLIETLVAIGIFASAITGLIAITASGISNATFVKNKFTAGYLALEGAELVHNIRDTASISGHSWNEILDTTGSILGSCVSTDGSNSCTIDPWDDVLVPVSCPPEGCMDMVFEKNTGKFSYHSYDGVNYFNSIFKRTISVQTISASEVRVVSRVDWKQGTQPHNVTYSYNLLNWTAP